MGLVLLTRRIVVAKMHLCNRPIEAELYILRARGIGLAVFLADFVKTHRATCIIRHDRRSVVCVQDIHHRSFRFAALAIRKKLVEPISSVSRCFQTHGLCCTLDLLDRKQKEPLLALH